MRFNVSRSLVSPDLKSPVFETLSDKFSGADFLCLLTKSKKMVIVSKVERRPLLLRKCSTKTMTRFDYAHRDIVFVPLFC